MTNIKKQRKSHSENNYQKYWNYKTLMKNVLIDLTKRWFTTFFIKNHLASMGNMEKSVQLINVEEKVYWGLTREINEI